MYTFLLFLKTILFADDTAVWTIQKNPVIAGRILQDRLESQAEPAQIPIHPNVLLRS
jgi:hypothetical protein